MSELAICKVLPRPKGLLIETIQREQTGPGTITEEPVRNIPTGSLGILVNNIFVYITLS